MSSIGEVAARTGLRVSTIRYYEAQGLLQKPARKGGKRAYDASIFPQIAVIKLAKAAGLSLLEMRALLSAIGEQRPPQAWRRPAKAKREQLENERERLLLRERIVTALEHCSCTTLEQCGRIFADASAAYLPTGAQTDSTLRARRRHTASLPSGPRRR